MAGSATQDFLEIKDIREGVLILKNNEIRGVMMVSSINFALMSEEEQSSIIFAFQSFLNSLDFSCQIVIQSRNINITPYIDSIKDLEEKQTNELMRAQISAYAEFIKKLVQGDTVMTKNFYIVIPYTLMEILGVGAGAVKQFGILQKFSKNKTGTQEEQLSEEDFQKCKNQLWQRMEFLAMGLKRCSLDAIPLTTSELIELFWSIHHPDQAEVGYYPDILPELMK